MGIDMVPSLIHNFQSFLYDTVFTFRVHVLNIFTL